MTSKLLPFLKLIKLNSLIYFYDHAILQILLSFDKTSIRSQFLQIFLFKKAESEKPEKAFV